MGVKCGGDAGVRAAACISRTRTSWHVVVVIANDPHRDPPEREFLEVVNGLLAANGRGAALDE